MLRAWLRTLGFTLAKTAPAVWEEYVRVLAPQAEPKLLRRLERERRDALDLARCASPDGELLFDRRWLLESIRFRAPMIHPLNLLQVDVLNRIRRGRPGKDEAKIRNNSFCAAPLARRGYIYNYIYIHANARGTHGITCTAVICYPSKIIGACGRPQGN